MVLKVENDDRITHLSANVTVSILVLCRMDPIEIDTTIMRILKKWREHTHWDGKCSTAGGCLGDDVKAVVVDNCGVRIFPENATTEWIDPTFPTWGFHRDTKAHQRHSWNTFQKEIIEYTRR